MQVARPPETHDVCPALQLSLHVAEQVAFGAIPEHASLSGHADDDDTYKHPDPSLLQIASVCASVHTEPACVQTVAAQPHAAVSPVTAHVWSALQVAVVTHAVQPFVPTLHVWASSLLAHCVDAALHSSMHAVASAPESDAPAEPSGPALAAAVLELLEPDPPLDSPLLEPELLPDPEVARPLTPVVELIAAPSPPSSSGCSAGRPLLHAADGSKPVATSPADTRVVFIVSYPFTTLQ